MKRDPIDQLARAELPLCDRIPYSSEIAPGVVKLKDGNGYCMAFEFEGVDFETCGHAHIDQYNKQVEVALTSLPAGTALWVHKIRQPRVESHAPRFPTPFCQWAHDVYMHKLSERGFIKTQLFVTLVLRPTTDRPRSKALADWVQQETDALESLEEAATRFATALKVYKPRRLMHFEESDRSYSELLSLLSFLINGHWERIPVGNQRLDHVLAASRITFAERSGVIAIDTPNGERRYASAIELREYPDSIRADQLDDLLYAQASYVETQSFSLLNNLDAIEKFRRQRSWMITGAQASSQEISAMDTVIDDLRGARLGAGEYHYSLTLFSSNLETVRQDRAMIKAELDQQGFKTVEQTTVPEAAWFFQCPGHWRMRTRVALMTSRNFAALSPLHSFMTGKKHGNPWGDALALFDSPSGQPFYLNLHVSPLDHDSTDKKLPGNTTIFGSTGSGKTTFEMFLIAMLDQYGARVVVLDMDRSTEIGLRAMGGVYKSFLRGVPTGINPFQWPDTPKNRAFCKKLLHWLITRGSATLLAEEENRISLAVDTVYELAPHQRRLGIVQQNLPKVGGNSLFERLRRWVGDGDFAWVFDNPTDTLDLQSNRRFGFDYSEFIDDAEICAPFVLCLLHAAESLKDGTPLAIFMEEFWKPLQNPAFSEFVRDQLKTIRKENGVIVLTTQQPDDVLDHPLAKTAVQQAVTGIFLPNPKAYKEDYLSFGLTETEFEIVRSLGQSSRAFLVKQDGKSAVCRFSLDGLDELIQIFSGSADNLLRLDALRERLGDAPEAWLPAFLQEAR